MKVAVYNQLGKECGDVEISEDVFGLAWNSDLVHQVIKAQMANRRAGTAHTKDRGEVSGGGKKPWRQKGTGRARHGSTRSPIWRHGGITFGPRNEKNYKQKIPKSMRNKALFTLLSAKLKDNKILFVDKIEISDAKTKTAQNVMNNLASIKDFSNLNFKKRNNVYMVMPKLTLNEKRGFRNLMFVNSHNMEDINPLDIANARYIIMVDAPKINNYLVAKK